MDSRWDRVVLPLIIATLSIAVAVIALIYGLPPPPLPAALVVLSAAAGLALMWRAVGWWSSAVRGDGRTVGSLASHCLVLKVSGWLGRRQRRALEADTRDATRVQEETLLTRLRRHADTQYGKRYEFSSITDVGTFRERHPVTDYEHYRKLIERVAAGEERVILAERPLILAMTSGTSGLSAMLLSTGDTNSEFFMQ
ncbi:hypothetical protein CRUP_003446, partial [Coryphaenoides rupestris]